MPVFLVIFGVCVLIIVLAVLIAFAAMCVELFHEARGTYMSSDREYVIKRLYGWVKLVCTVAAVLGSVAVCVALVTSGGEQ